MPIENDHVFVLAPSIAILFLAALLGTCWLVQRQQRFLLWQCSAYSLTAVPLGFQSFASADVLQRYAVLVGALYLLGSWCLTRSWAERWNVSIHPRVALMVSIATLSALFYFSRVEQNMWARVNSFSIGTGCVLLLPIWEALQKQRSKERLDQTFFWLCVIFTAYTFTRPLLITLLGFSDPKGFVHSTYWLITLMSILLFALLFTVLMCAITLRETINQLRRERDYDALTKILNRRAFHEAAQQRMADKRLYPMVVLAGDIDHFKRINDAWGHHRGDQVLQLVSSTLQHCLRTHDLVARFGGEEFVLLLTRIDLQNAESVAQRIRSELSADRTVLPQGPDLSMSFGIAPITDSDQLEKVLKEADELLYSAKNAGRDRVHVAGTHYPDISFESTAPMGLHMASLNE
ncbi:MAG: GGDEF domain-containing protein [Comamonas sp.]